MTEDRYPVHVHWEDTDAGGIVYHANYLKFMERARSTILHKLGVNQRELALGPAGVILVVSEANLKYRRGAVLDDDLVVLTRLTTLRRASMVFEQDVVRGDTLICTATLTVACVDPTTKRPKALPAALSGILNEYVTNSN